MSQLHGSADASAGAMQTASIAANMTKTAVLRHRALMLLRAFIVPLPLFAVDLAAAAQTGGASVYAQRRVSNVSSVAFTIG